MEADLLTPDLLYFAPGRCRGFLYGRPPPISACGKNAAGQKNIAANVGEINAETKRCVIYPTVSNSIINYQINDLKVTNAQLIIVDVNGKTLRSQNIQNTGKIDVSGLADGMYLVKIINAAWEETQKIIIKK